VRRHPRLVTGSAAAAIVATAAMVAIIAVIAIWNRRLGDANRTIRGNSEQIAAQNRELERRNEDLVQARGEAELQRDRAKEVTAFLVSTFRKPDPEMDGRDVKVVDVLRGSVNELEGRTKMAPATRAAIFAAIGQTYGGLGLEPEAVAVFEKVLELRRQELGDDHLDTIGAMADLGSACWVAGQFDRAIRIGEQVVAARRARQGDDHPDTLEAMNNLAVSYEDAGQLDRAISLFQQTLEAQKAKLGEDHLGTVMTMHNLADATLVAGHPERAIPTFQKAIAFYRARKGDKDPELLEMINNLARAYTATGQLDRAGALHQQVLDARLAKLGPDHPLTLTSTNNLATVYLKQGEVQRAASLLEGVLAARRTKPGPPAPGIFIVMINLASAYQAAGRVDRAIPLFEEALAGQLARLGGDHPDTLVCRRNLARAYERAGRAGDAERAFRQVVEAAGRAKPRNDRFYTDALAGLGGCLVHRQESAQAVPILRECLEITEKTQPGDWSTAEARGLLGEALAGLKDFAAAEPLLLASQKALTERAETIPPLQREQVLRDARERLVRLYQRWNKPAEVGRWER
jgi:tetratricopeptide (TPR) repeat protein